MPKTEVVTAEESVSITAKELKELRAAAKKALDTAITTTVVPAGASDGAMGTAIAEAFAKTFAPLMEGFTNAQKLSTDRIIEQTGIVRASYPGISVFNPKGDRDNPRPTFFKDSKGKPRRVFFCGTEQDNYIDRMTHEEIAAFDAFTEDCECRNRTWKAVIKNNGNTEELHIMLPKNDPDRIHEISGLGLVNILYELRTKGKKFPDANVLLTKMLAQATDPTLFIANLEKLLAQQTAA